MFLAFSKSRRVLGGLAAVALIATACSGAASTPTTAPLATTSAASPSAAPKIDCGTAPVKMSLYHENIADVVLALTDEFTKQYPNVTWDVKSDTFANLNTTLPRLLAGDNAPDIARAAMILDLHKDNLLLNLDKYATYFGWDKWPSSQFDQVRIAPDGTRGTGSIFAFGLNHQLTGVFYNKKLAAQIGMTAAPKTVDEMDAILAKAKAAGIQPIVEWNASESGGGLAFPLQQLMYAYANGNLQPLKDWLFLKAGATIDTPENLKAVQKLNEWLQKGYFTKDVNALQYSDAASRFGKGQGLFTFNGDWQDANYDKDMKGNIGFFTFPEGYGMSAPLTHVISAKAKHPDCAAFFLNWLSTNPTARIINVNVGGSSPGGPADMPVPTVSSDTIMAATLGEFPKAAKANGLTDFIANATGTIFFESWTPNLQKLAGGKTTPEQLLKDVQAYYLKSK